jgi:hypothetical protein
MSVLSCWSSSTSNVVIFFLGTACKSRICTDALEKPHCGISGVPLMKRTTGDDVTAFCNWARALLERKRVNEEDWNDDERRAKRNMTGDAGSCQSGYVPVDSSCRVNRIQAVSVIVKIFESGKSTDRRHELCLAFRSTHTASVRICMLSEHLQIAKNRFDSSLWNLPRRLYCICSGKT